MLFRTAVSLARASPRLRRALATSGPASPSESRTPSQAASRKQTVAREGLLALARVEEGIGNLAEAYAILRGIENKFGRLKAYRFLGDHETPSRYQKLLWVIFQFPASRRLVLDSSGSIDVRTPIVDSQRPGGIGMEELEGLLLPEDIRLGDSAPLKSWASSLSEAGRISTRTTKVEIRMNRGLDEFPHEDDSFASLREPIPQRSFKRNREVAHSFLAWKGFAEPKPLTQEVYQRYLGEFASLRLPGQLVDSPRMRTLISRYSRMNGVPDPNAPSQEQGPDSESRTKSSANVGGKPVETKENYTAKMKEEKLPTPMLSVEASSEPEKVRLTREEMRRLVATMGRDSHRTRQDSTQGTLKQASADSGQHAEGEAKAPPQPTSMAEKLKSMLGGWW